MTGGPGVVIERLKRIDWSQPGMVVSGTAHVALLAATLVAFSDVKPLDEMAEAVPVEVISASQLSQMTRGETTAKDVRSNPQPRADRQAEVQETKPEALELKRDVPVPVPRPPEPPVEQRVAALPTPPERPKEDEAKAAAEKAAAERAAAEKAAAEKAAAERARAEAAARAESQARAERARAEAEKAKAEEAKAKAEAEAEALEKARAAEAKAKAEAEARAKARAEAEAKARAEARAKAEAEAEAKRRETEAKVRAAEAQRLAALAEQARAEPPKPEPSKPAAPRAEAKPDQKFDPASIEKLLTSKEKAQQAPSTARETNRTASLGTASGSAQKLSPSQKDQLGALLKEQIRGCWSPPPGLASVDNIKPRFTMSINQDGSLSAMPVLANPSGDPAFRAVAESADRAIRRCAPFRIPAQYAPFFNDWRDWTITFDAREMLS